MIGAHAIVMSERNTNHYLRQLLQQIEDGAISTTSPVTELLRRCQVFAARLSISNMAEWVRFELNGYPDAVAVPDYRAFQGVARGHFLGPMGSSFTNAVLPASNLPKEYRDWALVARNRQSIAALEELAKGEREDLQCPWPGDLIARVQLMFYEHMALNQAWLSISRAQLVAAIEAVRNRVLTFALEAERYVLDDDTTAKLNTSSELSRLFQAVVYKTPANAIEEDSDASQRLGLVSGDDRTARDQERS